jgi:hypothetical protein
MSTTRQHIDQMERTHFTFEEVATHFYGVDIDFENPDELLKVPTLQDLLENLARVWIGIRPMLLVVAAFPLLPPQWRDALKFFVALTGELVTIAPQTADFKAGKDL